MASEKDPIVSSYRVTIKGGNISSPPKSPVNRTAKPAAPSPREDKTAKPVAPLPREDRTTRPIAPSPREDKATTIRDRSLSSDRTAWQVSYESLFKYIPTTNWIIVQYWHPNIEHYISFTFVRKGKLLLLRGLYDSYGRLERREQTRYKPYPRDIIKIISCIYDHATDGVGYLIYDPVCTLGCYLGSVTFTPISAEVIRKKLIAELVFSNNEAIKLAMEVDDILTWIMDATTCVIEGEEYESDWSNETPPGFLLAPVKMPLTLPYKYDRTGYTSLEQFVATEGAQEMFAFLADSPRIINGKYEGTQIQVINYRVISI